MVISLTAALLWAFRLREEYKKNYSIPACLGSRSTMMTLDEWISKMKQEWCSKSENQIPCNTEQNTLQEKWKKNVPCCELGRFFLPDNCDMVLPVFPVQVIKNQRKSMTSGLERLQGWIRIGWCRLFSTAMKRLLWPWVELSVDCDLREWQPRVGLGLVIIAGGWN